MQKRNRDNSNFVAAQFPLDTSMSLIIILTTPNQHPTVTS